MQLIELLELCKETYVTVVIENASERILENVHIDSIYLKDICKYAANDVLSVRTGWDYQGEDFDKEKIFTRIFIEIE